MKHNPRAEATRWILQAENDLEAARFALRKDFYAYACFMSQQSGEKALKSIAHLRGDRCVWINSLQEILDSLEETHPGLSDLRNFAIRLDPYYSSTRYPDTLLGGLPFETFSRGQAEEAVEMASEIVTSSRSFLE